MQGMGFMCDNSEIHSICHKHYTVTFIICQILTADTLIYPNQYLSFKTYRIIDAGAYRDNQVTAGTLARDIADLSYEFL